MWITSFWWTGESNYLLFFLGLYFQATKLLQNIREKPNLQLKYFNFKPSLKFWCCLAREFIKDRKAQWTQEALNYETLTYKAVALWPDALGRKADSNYSNLLPYNRSSWSMLRYFKFGTDFKFRCCRAQAFSMDQKFQRTQKGLNNNVRYSIHLAY